MRPNKLSHFLLLSALVLPAYVLPYPGAMPGNKAYSLKQIVDTVSQYWAFGSFARHKYELTLSDKKLVEAKTLFEYQQYLLALKALESSNLHFKRAAEFLARAGKEGKDLTQKTANFQAAAARHKEVLAALGKNLPESFFWQPEKKSGTELNLKAVIEEAIKLREI